MNSALVELYQPDFLTLSAEEESPPFEYDEQLFEQAAQWIYEAGGFTPSMLREGPAFKVIQETMRVLTSGITSAVTDTVSDKLVAALKNNAFIFSGFKTYHSLSEVGLSLTDEEGGVKDFGQFLNDVQQIDDKYNKNYLYAEYNHAVGSSIMAQRWDEYQQEADDYDLQYRTAADEKVREEHAILHDITLPVSDPFWTEFYPPNGWNCRCQAVQVRKGKYPTSDSAAALEAGRFATHGPKAQIFRYNPGQTLALFPDKHPYYKAPGEVRGIVNDLHDEYLNG